MRGTDLKRYIGHRIVVTLDDGTGIVGTFERATASTLELASARVVDGPSRPHEITGVVVVAAEAAKTVNISLEE